MKRNDWVIRCATKSGRKIIGDIETNEAEGKFSSNYNF